MMARYLTKTIDGMSALLRPTFLRPGERYTLSDFRGDAIAGVTIAVIQIPQSMALALIAGLPAVYGLYASIPGFIGSVWGSSRYLSTGPVAIVSFLTLTSIVPYADPGTPDFIRLAAAMALLVGIIYFLIGIFRFGFIIQLVPHSVIVGFSAAAALVILVSQIPTFLGITVPQHDILLQNVSEILRSAGSLSNIAFVVGALSLATLVALRKLPKTFPTALIVLTIGVAAAYFLHLGDHGLPLVGEVPRSLPIFTWPWIAPSILAGLIPKAAIIALVGYVGAHASAKAAARKTREHLDTNQEFVGQGLANIATAFFQGFPLSGSFSRTAMNLELGSKTAMASVITSLVTVGSLLFLAPLFYYMPRAMLSAIVIFAVIPLIDITRLREMYRVSAMDGFVAALTFVMVFFLKPDDAIFIGVVTALMLFVRQTVFGARVIEMGIDRELQILRGALNEKSVDTFQGICIARVAMSVYYANAAHIVAGIDEVIAHHVIREQAPLKTLILDVSPVNFIDVTGMEVLEEYFESLHERGIKVGMIYLRQSLRDSLERFGNFPKFSVYRNIGDLRSSMLLAHK